MRIVISTYAFPPPGGVPTYVAALAKAFAGAGFDVCVVTSAEFEPVDLGFPVVQTRNPLRIGALYAQADIVLLSNLSLVLALPALWANCRFGIMHHSTGAASLAGGAFMKDALRRRLMASAKHFTTSAFVGRAIGVPHTVITPTVEQDGPFVAARRPMQERRGVLFCGRLVSNKGVDFLLDRWPLIQDRLNVHELRIVGDGPLREQLAQRIRAPTFSGVTLTGELSAPETANAMGQARYCFTPSIWEEPFGMVALEALAAGAIVISSDRGGLPEATGRLGHMFDPANEASFVDALTRARCLDDRLMQSPTALEQYLADVTAHMAQFDARLAVDKILSAFAAEPRAADAA